MADAVIMGGAAGAATLPADRRRLSMEVMPNPEVLLALLCELCAAVGTAVRLLEARFGDGGCGCGEVSRLLWSGLTWICDCEEFLGLPRKNVPKMVFRVGGDSFPVCI